MVAGMVGLPSDAANPDEVRGTWRAHIAVTVEKFGQTRTHIAVGLGPTAREAYEAAMAEGVKEFWRSL